MYRSRSGIRFARWVRQTPRGLVCGKMMCYTIITALFDGALEWSESIDRPMVYLGPPTYAIIKQYPYAS